MVQISFTSEEFEDLFLRSKGIVHIKTAPYHPASNGLAERAVQSVKKGLAKQSGDCLHTKLQRYLLRYRITHSSTGKSPAELLNQRNLKTTLDLLHPNLQGKVQKQQAQMKSRHDEKASSRTFSAGDPVIVKNFSHGPKWLPGVIVKVSGPVSVETKLSDGRVVRRHVGHLQRRLVSQEVRVPPQNSQENRAVWPSGTVHSQVDVASKES